MTTHHGHRVGERYALQHEVGRGGAGAVWLAEDEILGRPVALKRIGRPPGVDDVDVARAEREARLAAQATHPNLVAVFDFVDDRDEHWLVMEYVDGTDLASMVRNRGPLPPAEAARILAEASRGLAAAHELGIVHRDVKPSNILVGNDGSVKLSDFGIARGSSDPSLTQTGLVTGSPAYLAPEVATGASATAASDIWSLGASFYHALSGVPPYQGHDGTANPVALLYRIAHEPVPTVETEPWAAALLTATMRHDAAQRPSAVELTEWFARRQAPALDDTQTMPDLPTAAGAPAASAGAASAGTGATGGSPDPAPPGTRRNVARTSRRNRLFAAAALAAVVIVIGVIALWPSGDDGAGTASPVPAESTAPSDPSESAAPSEPATSASPTAPTAADLEDFARTYVETASSDPDAGFEMLTPSYQEQSPRYEEFWGSVRNPEMLEVSGDPDAMEVTYTYQYDFAGEGRHTEGVVLELVRRSDQLLIDGDRAP